MNNLVNKPNEFFRLRYMLTMFALTGVFIAFGQESPEVKINGNDVGSWFGRNWIWVVAAIAVLLLILAFSGSSRSKRSTTVVSDRFGDVRRTSTTETEVE